MAIDLGGAVALVTGGANGIGEAWYVQPGRPAEPFAFRNVPGSRAPDGSRIGGVLGVT